MSDSPITEDRSGPRPSGAPASGPAGAPAARAGALARDLADFLIDFSIVLHKRSLYPQAHPQLRESAERFAERLQALLERRDGLTIGVARHQLIIGGVATDARNALLSDLARRLHRQRIASVRFQRSVTAEQIDDLLRQLGSDPDDTNGPLGLRLDRAAGWTGIQIQPPELGRLLLSEDGEEAGDGEAPQGPEGELWVRLANLALSADGQSTPEGFDPLSVARAIDDQAGQAAYDRVVLDYLGQLTQELSEGESALAPSTRDRVSRLVASLRPDTLRTLLEAGSDHAERRRFARAAAEVMHADAVVEVVEAAAVTTGQTISTQLLRLLHKFAQHAEGTAGAARADAETALRGNVARLIADWELADPNPDAYTAVLDKMVRFAPNEAAEEAAATSCEGELVLQMALEAGCAGPRVFAAIQRLAEAGQLGRVVALLDEAPASEAAERLWRDVATPERLRSELVARKVNYTAVARLAVRLGQAAADPLLDHLESGPEHAGAVQTEEALVAAGPEVLPPAAARFAQAPWHLQRHILALHRKLQAWPVGFSPIACTVHAHPQVRQEAYNLLLNVPQHRTNALIRGLGDADDSILRLVLQAALESCTPEVAEPVERLLQQKKRSAALRGLAVRVLAQVGGPETVPLLVSLATERRFFLRRRLAAKSPVVLAALIALAQNWPEHPQAEAVLAQARSHLDPEIRMAAQRTAAA